MDGLLRLLLSSDLNRLISGLLLVQHCSDTCETSKDLLAGMVSVLFFLEISRFAHIIDTAACYIISIVSNNFLTKNFRISFLETFVFPVHKNAF